MTKIKKRQVNIEALRIIAMLLVLVGHYNRPINGDVTYELVHTDILKAVGIAELKSWTFVCVPCFVIISGYFGIHWKWKGIFNFLFQIAFWGGFIYMLTNLLGFHPFELKLFIKSMTCFLYGVNWFITAYFGLYLFAPIINSFIDNSSERQLKWVVLAFFAYQTIFGWIFKIPEFTMGMTMTSLIGYYLLGGFLRKTTMRIFQFQATVNLLIFLGVGLFCVFLNCTTKYYGIEKDVYSYISPLQVCQTIYLFLFCKNINIRYGEKIILFFSSSAFAGLLMHSWEGGAMYMAGLKWCSEEFEWSFFPCMVYIFLFFTAACCWDKSRIWCWNYLVKVFRNFI